MVLTYYKGSWGEVGWGFRAGRKCGCREAESNRNGVVECGYDVRGVELWSVLE